MLNQLFYFQTIRKLTAAVGTLFSDIKVQRFSRNGNQGSVLKTVTVPLRLADGEKWLILNREKIAAQSSIRTAMALPRISYALTATVVDKQRKLPSMNRQNYIGKPDTNSITKFLSQLNPVPYDFAFQVVIETQYLNDAYQIVEQILPNFTPSFTLNINDIPELQLVKDVPVILQGVDYGDQYEGDFTEPRVIKFVLNFVCKAYIYPPISEPAIIKEVIAKLYPTSAMEDPATGTITVSVDPLDAMPNDTYQIVTEITE